MPDDIKLGDVNVAETFVIRLKVKSALVPTSAREAAGQPRTQAKGTPLVSKEEPIVVRFHLLQQDLLHAGFCFGGFARRPGDQADTLFATYRRGDQMAPGVTDERWGVLSDSYWSCFAYLNERDDASLVTINLALRQPFFVSDDPHQGFNLMWPRTPSGKPDKSGGPESKMPPHCDGHLRYKDGILVCEPIA